MAIERQTPLLRRFFVGLTCVPVMLALTGCPGDDDLPSPMISMPAYATAPTTQPAVARPSTVNASFVRQLPQPQQQAAQQAAPPRNANQHAQRVQQVIAQAEGNYNSGVSNYNANRLDAARLDFNAAVDGMLSCGIDIKSDPALSDEFERLLSAINSLEMVALKQGNGFSPKVEPAPLDVALNEVTFAANPVLVTKVTAELKTTQSDLPLVVNDYVAGYISFFSNSTAGHAHLKASLERAGKYKAMINRVLRQYDVPQDLIYQAVAESGFQPQAMNARSGAGGMWQFMPFANAYDLQRNGYFDERFDPEKSTIAYAKYMKGLYAQFGNWYLAMAAYDWGPGNVQRAVSRTGYADFWELYRHNALPAETKAYVPGIIAAAIMAKNPAQYGLSDVVPDAPVLYDTITTTYAIDLRLVADLTGSSVPEIVGLNPALLRLATPRDIPYDLRVPPGTKALFLDRLKDIPEAKRGSWRFHIVKPGETLEEIATSLHAHATEIAQLNDVTSAAPIQVGDELIVPIAASTAAPGEQRYRVGKRDTLVTVADRFGVTVEQLRRWNHLASNRVAPGRTLYVAEPIRLAPHTRESRRSKHKGSTTTSTSHSTHHATTTTPSKKKKKTR
ncbi:MAG: LysM peptidoglycan-binding domain-containing protein [Acidobacteriota bacterium]